MFLSKKERIKKLLLPGKPVHMRRLNEVAYRYGARIDDLRREGYSIDTIQLRAGEFTYRMNLGRK
jgi:hypothetical protein